MTDTPTPAAAPGQIETRFGPAKPGQIATQFDLTTKQGVLDHVFDAIIAQGRPSRGPHRIGDVVCMYRAPDGCKCAAGHLMPDDRYSPGVEGVSFVPKNRRNRNSLRFDTLQAAALDVRIPRTVDMLDLIAKLQRAHDTARQGPLFISNFTRMVVRAAMAHGLLVNDLPPEYAL